MWKAKYDLLINVSDQNLNDYVRNVYGKYVKLIRTVYFH